MSEYRMRITRRGQITIPAAIRRKLGLEAGGEVTIREIDGAVVMEAPRFTFESLRGSVKPLGKRVSESEMTRIAWEDKIERDAAKPRREP